jgi:hypothetical protein
MCGVVENTSNGETSLGIRLPKLFNPRGKSGLYWYAEDEVEFIDREETIMLNHNEDFKVAGVKFLSGSNQDKEYYYALFADNADAQEGDLVVVQTGHHGLALAQISSLDDTNKNKVQCSREIVSIVDTTAFEKRKAQRVARAKLKKEMDKRVSELQETALYELLAEKDPALATMLSDYKKLTGGT